MENGAKLSEAALAFEAAVKEKPDHVDAWLRLGLVQTQNEKELNGISALEECLKLDPKNLEAMKTLAISYINEGYDMSAFTMLDKWAETKYPEIWSRIKQQDDKFQKEKGFTHIDMNAHITKQFLQLANNLSTIDPEIQLCLGLLFYTKDDFDKTIDCFESALRVNPNDELMWNRLGASLANSNRSEEAIQAYHRALQLKPSFVRARYNLAVSSMNIDANYDPQILEIRRQAKIKIHEINHLSPAEGEKRESMIRELFGSVGKNLVIESPFYCDYGPNIHIGDDVAINHNLVILDGAEVRIGNSVFIAPNVGLYTAGHPIDVERRSKGLEFASPIIIEDYVWIGGGVSIVPGVTIKKGSVIAAGSVVIRDIPEGVVAGGNPCKVIRKITDEDKKTTNFIKRQ